MIFDFVRAIALQSLLAAIVHARRVRTKQRLAEVLRQRICRVCRAIDLERSNDLPHVMVGVGELTHPRCTPCHVRKALDRRGIFGNQNARLVVDP